MKEPRIGILWGNFPWETPPGKFGKLLSWGSVARNFTQALRGTGTVMPFQPPKDNDPDAHRRQLAAFLSSVDVLWADFYPGTAPALRLRSELGLPCPALLIAGGTLPKGAEALLFPCQDVVRPDDVLLFSSRADQEIWHRLVQWSRPQEYVVPCIVDTNVFHPGSASERAVTRARYGLPSNGSLLLYVGRRNIQKNLHGLFRLFASVRQRVPDAHLVLVGEEDDIQLAEFRVRNTGYGEFLEELAAQLGVRHHITFLDSIFGDELGALYRAADLVVKLSVYHRENFGLSQAEAQASGIPVVCSDWGGFKDVVRHGETGYLVETVITKNGVRVNWRMGAHYVATLLENAERRAEMGVRSRQWARETFAMAPVTDLLRGIVATMRDLEVEGTGPSYEPSDFARRLEEHKQVCGWYAGADGERDSGPRRFPRMFQGRDYVLYETLMRPYATCLAQDLKAHAVEAEWIPHYSSGVALDPVRRIVRDLDPIWPHEYHCEEREWDICTQIDGATPMEELVASLRPNPGLPDAGEVRDVVWRLWMEGFLLFDQGIEMTQPRRSAGRGDTARLATRSDALPFAGSTDPAHAAAVTVCPGNHCSSRAHRSTLRAHPRSRCRGCQCMSG